LNVVFSKKCFNIDKYGLSSGSPKERADDLNNMFSNLKVKAICTAFGGSSSNEIISLIDYENIKKNPKIFIGMSDVDIINLVINQKTNLITFHGAYAKMKEGLDFQYTIESFQNRLIEKNKIIRQSSPRICVREGLAEGKIIGCNLTAILKLAGTPSFPDFTNTIFFIEGASENTKTLISKIEQLKQIGVFNKIKGLVIGYIYGFQNKELIKRNNIKVKYEDIILDMTKKYNFPIIKTNDFGHYSPSCYLPIGAKVKLDATNKSIEILDDFLN